MTLKNTPIFSLIAVVLLASCSRSGCEGPALKLNSLSVVRNFGLFQSSGPRASLVLPNPIDATQDAQARLSDISVRNASLGLDLVSLLSPNRLENAFLKVRIRSVADALSTLATPNSGVNFFYQPGDVHYSEAMAYRSISSIQAYVEALGFPVVKTRPLYVMVQADGSTATDANAFYDHAHLNAAQPRTIKIYGSGQFAPGLDQDTYWHEFGHLFNESLSAERGIDYAGDSGAVFSEGGAIHECLADYLAESVSGKNYIGKWIARNFQGYAPGEPLRSAVDLEGGKQSFYSVAVADGTGSTPDRYGMGEWCSRVLWDIRQSFVNEDSLTGPILSDRVVFSAVSLLSKDTSVSQLQKALIEADSELHCGGHAQAIQSAFQSRGFLGAAPLSAPLVFSATPVPVQGDGVGGKTVIQAAAPGSEIVFKLSIQNTNAGRARNVRVRLESQDSRFLPLTYQQSFGDLEAGQTLSVGGNSGLGLEFSVLGQVDKAAVRGQSLPYTLRVSSENGQDTLINGVIQL